MTEPKSKNIDIYQGSKFEKSVHFYGGGKALQAIDSIAVGAPTIITAAAHGMPSISDTPIFITDVRGLRGVNTGENEWDAVLATYVDANSFSIPISTVGDSYKTGSGSFAWYHPTNLAGYTARMQIREKITDTATLVDLTSTGGDIVISATDGKITVTILSAITEALDFTEGVYDLELVDGSDEAIPLLRGKVFFHKEVTR